MEYNIENNVIIIKTHGMINLADTYKKMGYGTYCPTKFSALTLNHVNPSAAVIIFSTGNITIMGAKSYWGAMYIVQYIKRKLGLVFIDVKLSNVVIVFYLKNVININNLYEWDRSKCACNVIIFPSCRYSIPNTNIKANFFTSGKIVVTGCPDVSVASNTIHYLLDVIKKYNVQTPND